MRYLIGWNLETCIKALEWMKSSMACLLVLVGPNWKLELHVHIDESNYTLGVMLGQHLDNTIDRPIYYAS
jgi:hypothetical protein